MVQDLGWRAAGSVPENVCNISKKRRKSCFLNFQKNVKNVKKRNHLVMQALITQLPEVGKS